MGVPPPPPRDTATTLTTTYRYTTSLAMLHLLQLVLTAILYISLAISYCYYSHNMALGSQDISWGHTWTTDPIFEQKRAWGRNPGPDSSFYLNLTNYGNCTHLEMRRVISEWFHQLYPKQSLRASIIRCYNICPLCIIVNLRSMEMLTKNLQIHGASFQHNLRIGQSEQ